LTKADNLRATEPNVLAGYFRKKDKHITGSVTKALALAKKLAKRGDLILITGSLFVVGEARKLFPLQIGNCFPHKMETVSISKEKLFPSQSGKWDR